jgi:uncharacterized membrane protein YgcG
MRLKTLRSRAAAVICSAGAFATVAGSAYGVAQTRGAAGSEAAAIAAAKQAQSAAKVALDGLPTYTPAKVPPKLKLKAIVVHPRQVVRAGRRTAVVISPKGTSTGSSKSWDSGSSSSGSASWSSGGKSGSGHSTPPPPPPPPSSTSSSTPPPPPPPPPPSGSTTTG